MFTGCGQFLRMVEAEPGRGFKHPSDMVALRWVCIFAAPFFKGKAY